MSSTPVDELLGDHERRRTSRRSVVRGAELFVATSHLGDADASSLRARASRSAAARARATTRIQSVVASTHRDSAASGCRSRCHTSLVRHLSIASARGHHAAAGVGNARVSSAPCTVPSSPKRPCSAMKTRGRSPRASALEERGPAGSKACASTPFAQRREHGVARHERDLPLRGRPPISTATLPNSHVATHYALMCDWVAAEEAPARPPTPPRRHSRSLTSRSSAQCRASPTMRTSRSARSDSRFDRRARISASMSAARAPRVDDEVRVLLRHAARRRSRSPSGRSFDQPRRVVARRIAEHAARVRQVERLRRDALAPAAP